MRNLQGKTAVITGAGNGIGRALALNLAAKGVHQNLVDIKKTDLDETAQQVRAAGVECSAYLLDVSNREDYRAFTQEVLEHGPVDILINNAGIVRPTAKFEDTPLADFDKTIQVNLWGVIHGIHFFLPHLKNRPEAAIVNMSSAAGFIGIGEQIPYGLTKAAVKSISEGLRMELIDTSVEVVCVHPGIIDTRIVINSAAEGDVNAEAMQEAFTALKGVSPETAAAIIVRALRKGKGRVLIAKESRLFDWAGRLFPVANARILNRLMKMYTGTFEQK